MFQRVTLVLILAALVPACATLQATWRALWPPAPEHAEATELRYVPVPPPEPPPVQQQVSVSGNLLYVARLVLLDWWPPERMPTSETDPAARCALSPENYQMDIQELDDRYVVKISYIQQAKCGVIVDTDATYEVSRDGLEIISKNGHDPRDGGQFTLDTQPPAGAEPEAAQ